MDGRGADVVPDRVVAGADGARDRPERRRPPRLGEGYRAYATTMTPLQQRELRLPELDMAGHSQPIGTPA